MPKQFNSDSYCTIYVVDLRHSLQLSHVFHKYCFSLCKMWTDAAMSSGPFSTLKCMGMGGRYILHSFLGLFCNLLWGMPIAWDHLLQWLFNWCHYKFTGSSTFFAPELLKGTFLTSGCPGQVSTWSSSISVHIHRSGSFKKIHSDNPLHCQGTPPDFTFHLCPLV